MRGAVATLFEALGADSKGGVTAFSRIMPLLQAVFQQRAYQAVTRALRNDGIVRALVEFFHTVLPMLQSAAGAEWVLC